MDLPNDKMAEAEVSLRLAFHLLTLPASSGSATVAIDGAQVRVHGKEVFPISSFLSANDWAMAEQSGKNDWQGRYAKGGLSLIVTAQSGRGDVVIDVGKRRVRAESKKGNLVRKKGSPEYPLLREAIGQLMTVEQVETNDSLVVAVPLSDTFRSLATRWRTSPLIEEADIHFALIGRDGSVEGLPAYLYSARCETAEVSPAPLKLGHYRHYKGNEYIVVGLSRHIETEEQLVVYRQDYGDRGLWVRPLTMFLESVEVDGQRVPRFEFVGEA
ncbi:MAG: DUF1653 domain-containing protein [Pirellulaceae bacterium]